MKRKTLKLTERDLHSLIKRVVSESQLLTEGVNCLPGTAGTSCGYMGRIWCEVADGVHNRPAGCYCRPVAWCDQNGCNPECGENDGSGPTYPEGDNPKDLKGIGGGSGFVDSQGTSDRLATFNKRNRQIGESDLRRLVKRVISEEKKEKDCWICANWFLEGQKRNKFYCEKQQNSADGKCDGYRSARKCRKKCSSMKGVPMSDVGVKIGKKIIPGNEVDKHLHKLSK